MNKYDNYSDTAPFNTQDILVALGLDTSKIEKLTIHHDYNNGLIIELTLERLNEPCPTCQCQNTKIKGYVTKKIRHSIFNKTPCLIKYRARRYLCPSCNKTFYESNSFAYNGTHLSVGSVYNVLTALKSPNATFTSVGKQFNISASSIANIFDQHVQISRRPLPSCLSMDEVAGFKSNGSDYCLVLLDYVDKKITDLLPSRKKHDLIDYFSKIPKEERDQVEYISIDMWETYRVVKRIMFPKAKLIVDKFHVLQLLTRITDSIRISVMKKYRKEYEMLTTKLRECKKTNEKLSPEEVERLKIADKNYYLLKKFHWLSYSSKPGLLDPNVEKKLNRKLGQYLNYYDIYTMYLEIDPKLTEAIQLKDDVHRFYKTCTYEKAKEELEDLIIDFRTSNYSELHSFANTLSHWKNEIINSFLIIPHINKKINNGLIENRNKTIKQIKSNSNGYQNWDRFRNRTLYCLNEDVTFKI